MVRSCVSGFEAAASVGMSMRYNVHLVGVQASLDQLSGAGFSSVEACGMSHAEVLELDEQLKTRGMQLVSVHAPCPDTPGADIRMPGDWWLSADADERTACLTAGLRTIEFAQEHHVPAVFHLGNLGLGEMYGRLVKNGSAEMDLEAFDEYRRVRDERAGLIKERVYPAIEALLHAARGGSEVAFENRYRHDQVPNVDDFHGMRDYFGSSLKGWLDVGHARVQLHLGTVDPMSVREFASLSVGAHIHDSVGLADHMPPGAGDANWTTFPLPPAGPLVLEIDSSWPVEEVKTGRLLLAQLINQRE